MAAAKKSSFSLSKKLKNWGVSQFGIGFFYAMLGSFLAVAFAWPLALRGGTILILTSPLWIALITKKTFTFFWLHYVQHQFTSLPDKQGTLLEIRIPREIAHSPKAMELVYDALHFRIQMATKFMTHWRGHIRPWYSIEIISNRKGELKFYIWCWKSLVEQVEAAFYAQYPTIQLVPAEEDYARAYLREKGNNTKNINCWGMTYMLEKSDAYPIRTYYDYELDKDPKAEYKHDPLVTMLEQLSAHEDYEQFWMQIMIQPEWNEGWKATIKTEMQKIYDATKKPFTDAAGNKQHGYAQLKPMQFDIIRAMERSTMKLGFFTSIRSMYITDKQYNSHNSQTISRIFIPIGSVDTPYFNNIALDPVKHTSGFDFPWEFWFGRRDTRVQQLWDAWIARSAFAPPHIEDPMILTSEELATVFHIPGEEAKALGIKRVESKQKGAPPNLPI